MSTPIGAIEDRWLPFLDLLECALNVFDPRPVQYIDAAGAEDPPVGGWRTVDVSDAAETTSHALTLGPVLLLPPWGRNRVPTESVDGLGAETKRDVRGNYLFQPAATLLETEPGESSLLTVLLPASILDGPSSLELRRRLSQSWGIELVLTANVVMPGVHPEFSVAAVLLSSDPSGTTRWFKLARDADFDQAGRSLRHILRIREGSNEEGFVRPSADVEPDSWGSRRYDPRLDAREESLGAMGQTVPLSEVSAVLPGQFHRHKNADAIEDDRLVGVPVVHPSRITRSGTLSNLEASVVQGKAARRPDVDVWVSEEWATEDRRLQSGDLLVARISSRSDRVFRIARVNAADLPAVAGENVFVIRLHDSLSRHERQMTFAYLRSTLARQLLRQEDALMLRLDQLRALPVPQPDSDLADAFDAMQDASDQFESWREDSEDLLGTAFEASDLLEARSDLIARGRMLRAKVRAARGIEDFDHIVRTQFPFPVAYRYRTVTALITADDLAATYTAILDAAEILVTYMGSVALSMSRGLPNPDHFVNPISQQVKTGRGIGMGDWVAVIDRVRGSKSVSSLETSDPLRDIAGFLKSANALDALKRLAVRRNDESHGRRVDRLDLLRAIEDSHADLLALLDAAVFLIDAPLIHITSVQVDSLTGLSKITSRELVGDHPVVPSGRSTTSQSEMEANSLYCKSSAGKLRLLRPWLITDICPQCRTPSIFHLDKIAKGALTMKSLEHGHTIELPATGPLLEGFGLSVAE